MEDAAPVVLQVSRMEVEMLDTDPVVATLEGFIPVLLEAYRNRVQIEVTGYNDDPRELFDIPEARAYFQRLFDQAPGLFYWIDVNSYMFVFLGLMLYEPVTSSGDFTLKPLDIQSYLARGVRELNQFCERHGVSADPTSALLERALRGA